LERKADLLKVKLDHTKKVWKIKTIRRN